MAALGSCRPTFGCLIVALPMAMAITLQMTITSATLGDQLTEAGAMARRGASMDPDANGPIFRVR